MHKMKKQRAEPASIGEKLLTLREAAGVLQINALVPQSSATGGSVPIMITIGNTPSTAGVTMAVK